MMQIIGFAFTKISGEKFLGEKKEKERGAVVNSSLDITQLEEERVQGMKDQQILKVVFDYSTSYDPDFAKISFSGIVMFSVEKSKYKDVLQLWKSKQIDEEIRMPIVNFILTKCNLKSLILEEELGLPLHMQLQKVETGQKSYTG